MSVISLLDVDLGLGSLVIETIMPMSTYAFASLGVLSLVLLLVSAIHHSTGHFERRIAFGYDADLSQVKADFDRGILRISVPRRAPTITSFPSTARHAPIGRT